MQGIMDRWGRFTDSIASFIGWSHDIHVVWKPDNMRDASNLILPI